MAAWIARSSTPGAESTGIPLPNRMVQQPTPPASAPTVVLPESVREARRSSAAKEDGEHPPADSRESSGSTSSDSGFDPLESPPQPVTPTIPSDGEAGPSRLPQRRSVSPSPSSRSVRFSKEMEGQEDSLEPRGHLGPQKKPVKGILKRR